MNLLKKPSTTGGIIYLVCVAMMVFGLAIVGVGRWRQGVTLMGLGFGLAFTMRLVLPEQLAGMLHVRRRLIDLAVLATCGGLMLVLAVVIPNRP